ncbi:hypothetical protein B0H19DRAFT_1263486 [Mycena capillaripes]|nr:hypothetical protein B0H19DRAFT_1263486 [Mycena capillaripes]
MRLSPVLTAFVVCLVQAGLAVSRAIDLSSRGVVPDDTSDFIVTPGSEQLKGATKTGTDADFVTSSEGLFKKAFADQTPSLERAVKTENQRYPTTGEPGRLAKVKRAASPNSDFDGVGNQAGVIKKRDTDTGGARMPDISRKEVSSEAAGNADFQSIVTDAGFKRDTDTGGARIPDILRKDLGVGASSTDPTVDGTATGSDYGLRKRTDAQTDGGVTTDFITSIGSDYGL